MSPPTPSPAPDRDPPGRLLDCIDALAEAVTGIVGAQPGRTWHGDETEFWPVRAAARRAGWTPDEIDNAVVYLAAIRPVMDGS